MRHVELGQLRWADSLDFGFAKGAFQLLWKEGLFLLACPINDRMTSLPLQMRFATLAIVSLALLASEGAAQDRIYGAAITEADSYPRGAVIDQQYADLPAWSMWPYGQITPWRVFGGYPGWLRPGPWGWRNAILAPRYAPFSNQGSPYYEWPYEWSYEPNPMAPGAIPHEPPHRPYPTGPRRLFW